MRVPKGCPLCEGDVLGTMATGFYCKHCNLMFRKRHVRFKHYKREAQLTIKKHFTGYEKVEEEHASLEVDRMELPMLSADVDAEFLDTVSEKIKDSVATLKEASPHIEAIVDKMDDGYIELEVKKKGKAKRKAKKKTTPKPKKTAKKAIQKKKPVKKRPKKTVKKRASTKRSAPAASTPGKSLEHLL